jgi:acetyltransferase-like isoleucine patch superfamily enzyme
MIDKGSAPARSSRLSVRGIIDRVEDWRRNQWMFRALRRATAVPPPTAFGSFGRSVIVPPARIDSPQCIFIGDDVVIHEYAWLSVVQTFDDIVPRFVVGDRTRIGRMVQISCVGEIVIEEDVGISDGVLVADTSHEYEVPDAPWFEQSMIRPLRTVVCAGTVLGHRAIILPGVTVGRGSYVLERSVVTRDVPPGTVVSGNPARVVGETAGYQVQEQVP